MSEDRSHSMIDQAALAEQADIAAREQAAGQPPLSHEQTVEKPPYPWASEYYAALVPTELIDRITSDMTYEDQQKAFAEFNTLFVVEIFNVLSLLNAQVMRDAFTHTEDDYKLESLETLVPGIKDSFRQAFSNAVKEAAAPMNAQSTAA